MKTGTHLEMHQDHERWLNDLLLWADEAAIWEREQRDAAAELARVEEWLRGFAGVLAKHRRALAEHGEQFRGHEHAVAQFEQTGDGDQEELLLLAKHHRDEAAAHARTHQEHTELKERHRAILGAWMNVLREIARVEAE